jgi:hypothetical protein
MVEEVDYELVVGDPPKPTRPVRGVWIERLAPLMLDYEGEWVRVAEGPKKSIENMASALRNNRYQKPAGIWQFTTRRYRDNETGGLWAKYVGPDNDPGKPDVSGDSIDDRGALRRPEAQDAVDEPLEHEVAATSLE